MKKTESHPDWYYSIPDMRTLILGTFPPHRQKWNFEFYYPNNMNRFWKILAKVGNTNLTEWKGQRAVEQRKQLMEKLRIGVQNIGLTVERNNQSALDKDITILKYQNILSIINKHHTLQKILIPGYSGKTSTYHSFIEYLKNSRVKHSLPETVNAGSEFTIYYKRPILCIICNSTSTSARRVNFEMLVDQFKSALG